MKEIQSGLIQVAGIIDSAEAQMLIESGVTHLGFPLQLAFHKEDILREEAGKVIRSLKPPHFGVVITYLHKAEDIVSICRQLGAHMVQLHGDVSLDELENLRKLDSGLFVIKSLITKDNNLSELETKLSDYCPYVDAFITDTYDPVTGACGATGKTHDWDVSRRLVSISPKPVILAGGLNPDNVRKAVQYVRPAGVDVHTGVESSNGRKDPHLVHKFVTEAKDVFEKVNRSEK